MARQHDQAWDDRGRFLNADDDRWSRERMSRGGYGDYRDYGAGRHERGFDGRGRDDRGSDDRGRFMSDEDRRWSRGRSYNPYDRDDADERSSFRGDDSDYGRRGPIGDVRNERSGYRGRSSGWEATSSVQSQGGGFGDFRSSGANRVSGGGYSSEGGGFYTHSDDRPYGRGRPQGRDDYYEERGHPEYRGRGQDRDWQGGWRHEPERGWRGQAGSRDFGGWSSDRDRYGDRIGDYPHEQRGRDDDRFDERDRGWFNRR